MQQRFTAVRLHLVCSLSVDCDVAYMDAVCCGTLCNYIIQTGFWIMTLNVIIISHLVASSKKVGRKLAACQCSSES
jgi:hypothetical protein